MTEWSVTEPNPGLRLDADTGVAHYSVRCPELGQWWHTIPLSECIRQRIAVCADCSPT